MHEVQASDDAGYAMAALLVALAVMAVLMTVAMPVWRHEAQREKETELIWRGEQYDRALQLYRRKFNLPGVPSLDILIQQRFLRKKYKDPITGTDFELKPVGPGGLTNLPPGVQQPAVQPNGGPGQLIGGVRSKSKAKSIRALNGRTKYNEWEFAYVPYSSTPKAPGTGATPGGPTTPVNSPGRNQTGSPLGNRPPTSGSPSFGNPVPDGP